MASRSEIISGCVNAALLDKADCFFKNDDDGVWIELLQNARRAGALLRKAIDWNANQLAEQLGVQKIHFERIASGQRGWEIALDMPDVPEATPND